MEMETDSEKQQLIETSLEPVTWMSSAEDSDPSEDDVCVYERPCWITANMNEAEREEKHRARRKLLMACVVSLLFMTGEVVGGYAAHSLAIMTDAAHLLTDFGSIVMSIFSLWISSRPPSETMTFGWHRAEILGMFFSVLSIWAVTAVLVLSAVHRISEGDYDIDSKIMLLTSGCAVGVNFVMILILQQSGASHGHSHGIPSSWHQKSKQTHSHSNASVKAAFIHVLGDLLQSIGVLLAAVIIHVWPEYKVADPICTFLFSVLVVGTTFPITKDVFRVLMEGVPQGISFSAVREELLSVEHITAVNQLHMWSLNMNRSLLSANVSTEEEADSQTILQKATKLLRSEFGFSYITIQVEPRKF